jgi:hypothetical protein
VTHWHPFKKLPFFFFSSVLGLELRAFTLSHSTSPIFVKGFSFFCFFLIYFVLSFLHLLTCVYIVCATSPSPLQGFFEIGSLKLFAQAGFEP